MKRTLIILSLLIAGFVSAHGQDYKEVWFTMPEEPIVDPCDINIVSNGTFDSSTGWSLSGGWAISGGVASYDGDAAYMSQDPADLNCYFQASTSYDISFDITNLSGNCYIRFRVNNANSYATTLGANGSFSGTLTTNSGTDETDDLYIWPTDAETFDIDNIVIVEQ